MSRPDTTAPFPTGALVGLGLIGWLLAALAAGVAGTWLGLPGALVSGIVWSMVLAALAGVWHIRAAHDWMLSVNLRVLILPHVLRLAGFPLLVLFNGGPWPWEFTLAGGMADVWIAVAALALAVWAIPMRRDWQWKAVLTWNVLGLADLLVLIIGAMRFTLADPALLHEVTAFPMCLLPTFIVPLGIASHILLFDRLRHETAAYAVRA